VIPILIIAINLLVLREPLGARQAIGVAVSLCGVLLIVAHGDLDTLLHLMPLFGSLLAWLFLGEALAWYHYCGAVLIFSGLFITSR